MDLESYLNGLKVCPDTELTSEYGILEIWTIFLCGKYDDLVKGLTTIENFKLTNDWDGECFFDYLPGTVDLKVLKGLSSYGFVNLNGNNSKEEEHHRKQIESYNISIVLYPYQRKSLGLNFNPKRAIAIVADEICNFARENEISLCLPNSIGSKYFRPQKDLSKIVYS